MKTKIEVLEEKIAEIECNITELGNKRFELNSEIRELKEADAMNRLKRWNIHNGSKLVLFSKNFNGYDLIKTYIIDDINSNKYAMKTVEGDYSDYEYECYEVRPSYLQFSELERLETAYHVYEVTDKGFAEIQAALCNLNVTIDTLSRYEMDIGTKQGRKIS